MDKTEHCGMEIKEAVWRKWEVMEPEAEEHCIEEMNMCVDAFENIGNTKYCVETRTCLINHLQSNQAFEFSFSGGKK